MLALLSSVNNSGALLYSAAKACCSQLVLRRNNSVCETDLQKDYSPLIADLRIISLSRQAE